MARVRTRRTANRGDTPLSPPRQTAESPSSSPVTRRSTKSQSVDTIHTSAKAKKSGKQLPEVQEEDTIQVLRRSKSISVPPAQEEDVDDEDEALNDDDDDSDESSGVESAHYLEAQLEGLDRDLIIDSLPSLFRESSNVLSLFRPEALPNLLEDIRSSVTTVGKRFINFQARFDVTSQPCRNDNFLVVDVILHKLADSPDYNQGPWRPDAILYLANLSIFVSAITTGDDKRITSTLDLMYNNFPGPYLLGDLREADKDDNIYGTDLIDATIELGIAIRTEFFLRAATDLVESPSFDPDNVLRQTFFEDEGKLRGFEELTDASIVHKVEGACMQRISAIRRFFSKNSKHPIDVQGIRSKFPQSKFMALVVDWASKRRLELNAHVSAQGGPEAIAERIMVDELTSLRNQPINTEAPSMPALIEDTARHTPIPKSQPRLSTSKLSMSAKMQKFKAMKARQAASEEESGSEEGSEDKIPTEEEVPQSLNRTADIADHALVTLAEDDDSEQQDQNGGLVSHPPQSTQLSIVPTQETARVLAAAKRQAIQSNKENIDTSRRFTDRQAGAKRVDWNESQDTGKRRAVQISEANEDDDLDSFEIDTRPSKKTRVHHVSRKNEPGPTTSHDADEVEEVSTSEQTGSRLPPLSQPEPSRPPLQLRTQNATGNSRPPPSSAPGRLHNHDSQSPPRSTQTQRVNIEAKANVRRFNDFSGPKAPQVRRAWGIEEVERLMDFVAIYGTAWSTMMSEDLEHPDGPKLQGRDQVGLKDKARNIKMDFLKACRPLPEGFASVSMKASDLRKLDALGIPRLDGQGGRFIQGEEE